MMFVASKFDWQIDDNSSLFFSLTKINLKKQLQDFYPFKTRRNTNVETQRESSPKRSIHYPFNNSSRHDANQPLIDPNSWHARVDNRGGWSGGGGGEGGRKPRERKRWRVEQGRKSGGEGWMEEAWKTDATSLVHFVLTLSTRMSVYVAARSYVSLPYMCIRTRMCTHTSALLHCGPSSNGASARACARTCAPRRPARCRVLSILGITRTFLLECYRVLAPIRGCKRVSLSLSLFPLNNY